MKRILLTGAAVAGLFTAGITAAASAAPVKYTTKNVTKYVTVTETKLKSETKTVSASATCKLTLTTQADAGTTAVTAGGESGSQFGDATCPTPLRGGALKATFTQDDSGDLSGSIQHWFKTGTVYGTYSLQPGAPVGPPTSTSFGQAAFTGTMTIKGAGGALSGTTGTGKLTCSTDDSVHYSCTEKLSLKQTVTEMVPTKVKVRTKVVVKVKVPVPAKQNAKAAA